MSFSNWDGVGPTEKWPINIKFSENGPLKFQFFSLLITATVDGRKAEEEALAAWYDAGE